jgi:3-oxoacyl-[acyl-carrier-protein] synthase-3
MRPVGIVSVAVVPGPASIGPEAFIPDAGLRARAVETLRIRAKRTFPPGTDVERCEAQAARSALETAGIGPEKIDLVIHASTTPPPRSLYSRSAGVMKAVGAGRAYGFDVMAGCNGATWALANAKSLLLTHDEWTTALVLVSDQLASYVDYANETHLPLFNWADAVSAVVLRKGEARRAIVGEAFRTDPTYGDSMHLSPGAATLTMETSDEIEDGIKRTYKKNYEEMIRAALGRAGVEPRAVAGVFMNQGDWRLTNYLSKNLGIAPEAFQRTHEEFGHIGGSDVLLGLMKAQESGRIRENDHVVLASSAVGFSWGALVLKA